MSHEAEHKEPLIRMTKRECYGSKKACHRGIAFLGALFTGALSELVWWHNRSWYTKKWLSVLLDQEGDL